LAAGFAIALAAGFAAALAAGFAAALAAGFAAAFGAAFFTAAGFAAAFGAAFLAGAFAAGAFVVVFAMRCPLCLCRWPLVTRRANAYLTRAFLASEALHWILQIKFRLRCEHDRDDRHKIDKESSRLAADFRERNFERRDSCDLLVKLTNSCGNVP
jgi:hypothetical protein